MTHLEILAGRVDTLGETAIYMTGYCRESARPRRAEYYQGQAVAFGRVADMLREEAAEREGIDKEVSE